MFDALSRPDLTDALEQCVRASIAPTSLKAYSSSIRSLRAFADKVGLDPDAPLTLLPFLLDRVVSGASFSSLTSVLAASAFFSNSDPPPLVRAIVNCAKRNHTTKHTPPAPPDSVHAISQWGVRPDASRDDSRAALFAALSFAALLRISEASALRWEDIREELVGPDLILIVHIRKAKNDQLGEGRETRVRLSPDSPGLSLFRRMQNLCSFSLFVFASWSTSLPLTHSSLNRELKRACAAVGVSPFTSHSLRSGGASASAAAGTPLQAIQKRGRWRSSGGMASYIHDSLGAQGGALPL